jgi:flagellar protein FlgJ
MPIRPEAKTFPLGVAPTPVPIGKSNEVFSVDPKIQSAKTMSTEDKQDAELMKSCQQLEGVLFNMMLKEMRKTIQKSGLLQDSQNQEEIFTDMMDQDVADKMAQDDSADTGVAKLMFMQLSGNRAYHSHASKLAGAGAVSGKSDEKSKTLGKEKIGK